MTRPSYEDYDNDARPTAAFLAITSGFIFFGCTGVTIMLYIFFTLMTTP